MFDAIRGIVLGAVQGLTEFLPVSSSGHLILAPKLLGWSDQGLAFDTVLHLGTLTALLWFFRRELPTILRDRALLTKIGVATLPALIIGFLLNDWIEATLRSSLIVSFNLVLWGIALFAADRRAARLRTEDPSSTEGLASLTWKQALLVGFAQPLALIPGTSRSGVTITAGLTSGLSRTSAARFSFLLSIPVTGIAGCYGLLKVLQHGAPADGMLMLVLGFLSAAVVGAWAIRFLLRYVSTHRYDIFVYYRFALALAVTVLV